MKAMTTMVCVAALAFGLGCDEEVRGALTLTQPPEDASDNTAAEDPVAEPVEDDSDEIAAPTDTAGGGNVQANGDDDDDDDVVEPVEDDGVVEECLRGSLWCECDEGFWCDGNHECDFNNICKPAGTIPHWDDEVSEDVVGDDTAGDDDSSGDDDTAEEVDAADDDTEVAGDDDSSTADDDIGDDDTAGDDDVMADDDSSGDDDSAGDDDTAAGDDDGVVIGDDDSSSDDDVVSDDDTASDDDSSSDDDVMADDDSSDDDTSGDDDSSVCPECCFEEGTRFDAEAGRCVPFEETESFGCDDAQLVCLRDTDGNGLTETVCASALLYNNPESQQEDAYLVGNTPLDYRATEEDLVLLMPSGFHCRTFNGDPGRSYEFTLVGYYQSDGVTAVGSDTSLADMDWFQNATVCLGVPEDAPEAALCHFKEVSNADTPEDSTDDWRNFLFLVRWNPATHELSGIGNCQENNIDCQPL